MVLLEIRRIAPLFHASHSIPLGELRQGAMFFGVTAACLLAIIAT
jgi:hypothetical protein